MGQGYSLTTLTAASAGIDVPEMADLSYEKSLGNARFMKCIRARHKSGLVVVKVVMKPYASLSLHNYVKILIDERKQLASVPNALSYHRIVETSANGYLVRQYINSSLYDRLSTRPFLEDIEKKWLAFQLLCAVRDCHARDIYHGDIKTENVLVTSWNWLYLTDFASAFKPVYLPYNDPADFNFFYGTGRRICYTAPERFLEDGEDPLHKSPINWAMDIFSVGCVIAELFLESPAFSLSQLFEYRKHPEKEKLSSLLHLNRIADESIRELVEHMLQADPQARYPSEMYLTFWKDKAFPEYFYSFLHQYMFLITDPTSGASPLTQGSENLGEADDRIDRVYNDFDKISYFLGYGRSEGQVVYPKLGNELFPLHLDIPNNRHGISRSSHRPPDDGTLIFLTLVVASMRSTARATAKVRACELLLAFSERVPDEVKLDRILPYLMSLLDDDSDMVQVAVLRTITQMLMLVKVASVTNLNLFPDYLLPRFRQFVSSSATSSAWVRSTYATCLGPLATVAAHFLDLRQALRKRAVPADNDYDTEDMLSRSMYDEMYETARSDLMIQVEQQTTALLTDPNVSVRRALLTSVPMLCVFFGSEKASDVILSHLNTYLNDRDWMLKCAFFESIVGVATYVGTAVLEEYILPLMVQALTDPEETVVEKVIRSFSTIAQLGIFQRSTVWELLDVVARFTMHPNEWIREAAAQFIAASSTFASLADIHGIIIPTITRYLHVFPADMTELSLLDNLKKPLSRVVLDLTSSWALKAPKSPFWKSTQLKTLTFSFGDAAPPALGKSPAPKLLTRMPRNEDDENFISRLRKVGMTPDDEFKLLALQDYIWRSAHRRQQDDGLEQDKLNKQRELNGRVALQDHDVGLQLIFFDSEKTAMAQLSDDESAKQTTTIEQALYDATSTQAVPLISPRSPTFEESLPRRSKPKDIAGSSTKVGRGISTAGLLAPNTEPSSYDSKRSLRITDQTIQRRGSAISLMGLREGSKAAAETSMDTTNAFGKVERQPRDGTRSPSITGPRDGRIQVYGKRIRPFHSYKGNDPNILKLLDTWYSDNYPIDLLTFGRVITPVREETPQRGGSQAGYKWRPEGIFIALLNEHTDCINRVVAAPDHKFFVTGSNDGTVKVWDTGRLEKSVQHRSRLTHHQGDGVRVTALGFVENTHCFISAGSDGSIHVVQVECIESSQETSIRYPRMTLARDYQLPPGSYTVWLEHHQADSQSFLVLATNDCKIYGIELRTMEIVYELKNPAHHGRPTTFCIDKRNHWLLLGTSESVLDLWDLRFGIRLKSWGFPNGSPIHRISPPVAKGTRKHHVAIAGGPSGVITVFNVEKGTIREVYTSSVPTAGPIRQPAILIPTLLDLDQPQNRPGGTISRFTPSSAMSASASSDAERGVRSLHISAHIAADGSETKHLYMLSAGPDWKVRFWECGRPDASMVVSGLDVDEPKPMYDEFKAGDAVQIVVEKPPVSRVDDSTGTPGSTGGRSKRGSAAVEPTSPGGPSRRKSKAVVSLQQQNLLRGHKDTIMDVALLESPYGMVVSVDRSGVIYVHS